MINYARVIAEEKEYTIADRILEELPRRMDQVSREELMDYLNLSEEDLEEPESSEVFNTAPKYGADVSSEGTYRQVELALRQLAIADRLYDGENGKKERAVSAVMETHSDISNFLEGQDPNRW